MITLILGGARSGKSRYAEQQALRHGEGFHYIATAVAGDPEMAQRIARHQRDRDGRWQLVEEPTQLAQQLEQLDRAGGVVLVDCLTLWLCNTLESSRFERERAALLELVPRLDSDLYLVSNEVGSGIVPLGNLSRTFVDQAGWLNQDLAALSDRVVLVVAGLPLELKS